MVINVSLDTAKIITINMSAPDFRIWQHFNSNWTTPHQQKLANVHEVPVAQLYKHMINMSEPINSFPFNKDDDKDPYLIWAVLLHPGTYIGTIGMIFTVCIDVYCFKGFWYRSSSPRHWPLSPVSLQHAIMNDDVEAASIYKIRGMVEESRRLHKNYVLHIEWETTRLESHCKFHTLWKGVPIARSLAHNAKIQGMQ